jgi:hypothetical protein
LKKLDVLIVAVVLVACAVAIFFSRFGSGADAPGGYAEIYVKNELVDTIELREDQTIEVENSAGYNLLEVKDGGIRMVEADCLSKMCVHSGTKSFGGDTIICLPNRVVVKIVGAPAEEGVDAVAK